ncbi:MAG TPA: insulinase family protein, partial [Vicinamibacterales bacterium]|nr:insulinase family protein [Vicinamibacterales bacterium]
ALTAAQSPKFPLNATLPLSPDIKTGKLPNGLKFYIRKNARPEKRVSLRLAVKAGSLEEHDDQLGLAHLIEHMAFNGSEHFKPGEVVSYFERLGARLGPHVNAQTSFDETIYMLDLPTDQGDVLAKGLLALADFAGGLTFDPKEVDKERGVVIEEWRGGLGAGSRIRDKQIPIIFYKSRYAERLPIGKPDIIRNAPVSRLRAFYDTWYRPERMAVIAVGDIDPAAMQASITSTFGGLRDRAKTEKVPNGAVTMKHPVIASVITDPELTRTSVQVLRKHVHAGDQRVADYRQSLVDRMAQGMLNDRLAELARKPDAKFLGAGVGTESITPEVEGFVLSARTPDDKVQEGMEAVAVEAKRARDFGFSTSELERVKKNLAAGYEQVYQERDKSESPAFAQELLSLFLQDEPAPGIAYEYELVKELLPTITTADVAESMRRLMKDEGKVILVTAPQKDSVKLPADSAMLQALASAESTSVTPWSDTTTDRALVEHKPQPATVVSRREIADVGVTVVKFSNGVEAWFKPTTFKNDQVLYTLSAEGGASFAACDDFEEAALATNYVRTSGVGGLKALDLEKMLAGKNASAAPYISLSTHGISGSSTPMDLETGLQLLYLSFTAPGDDPQQFDVLKRQLLAAVANRGRAPGQVYGEKVEQINTSNHCTSQPLTAERINQLDRAKMLSYYKARFSNAADFTFFMVGAFKVDEVLPLVAEYVGGLPTTGPARTGVKDVGIHFPNSVIRDKVEMGREPRANVQISFYAEQSTDPVDAENVAAATTVFDIALRDVLREDLGQTYTVSVGEGGPGLPQKGGSYMRVSFGAAPENISSMIDRVLTELKKLQQDGPSADLTNRAKETARRSYETALQQNGYWLGRLQSVHIYNRDPKEILTRPARIDAVTPATIQAVFKRDFPLDRYTVVTLTPAAPPVASAGTSAPPGQAGQR